MDIGATSGCRDGAVRRDPGRGARRTASLVVVAAAVLLVEALWLATAAPAAHASAGARTGLVHGVVVLGPQASGEHGTQLSWPPVEAVVKVFRHGRDDALRTLRTGDDGRFTVRLKAGTYRFTAELPGPSIMPIAHDVVARVRPGHTNGVRLWLDTGLEFPEAKDAGQIVTPAETPAGHHRYRQGVLGTTRRGPIVPTVRPEEPSDEPCGATLMFYRPNGRVVARIASTKQDGFLASLPAATYVVTAASAVSTFDRGGPFTLRVPKGQWLSLTVMFDTGIRFVGAGAGSPAYVHPR
jgi:hypothetical protein